MNVYMLVSGNLRYFVAAENEEEAYTKGTDPNKHPDLHFRPFEIVLVEVEGYTITVTSDEPMEPVGATGRRGRRAAGGDA